MARILVVGGGAIGLYCAGRLAAAGNAVTVKTRSASASGTGESTVVIERGGSVESCAGIEFASILPRPGEPTPLEFDLIIMATKSWQVGEAGRDVAHLLAPDGRVLTTQNGVDAPDRLAESMPVGSVIAGTVVVIAQRLDANRVTITGAEAMVTLGAPGRAVPDAGDTRVLDTLRAAGLGATWSGSIQTALWKKLALIASYGGVGVLGDATVGQTRSVPETRNLVVDAMREAFAVGNACGAQLTDGDLADIRATYEERFADSTTASMHRDLLEGRPSELEDQNGAIVRHGHRLGVPVPIHETIVSSQLPRELRARAATS